MRASLSLPALALVLGGCPKTGGPAPAPSGLPPSAPHHGAWYGSGMAFPEDHLCLVFCPDGRLYAGDVSCSEVRSSEFATPWTYELAATQVQATRGERRIAFDWLQSGTHAVASIAGRSNLPMDQQSTTSPLCDNAPWPDAAPDAAPPGPLDVPL